MLQYIELAGSALHNGPILARGPEVEMSMRINI